MNDRTCEHCGFVFALPCRLQAHQARKTPCAPILEAGDLPPALLEDPDIDKKRCRQCGRVFSSYTAMRRHVRQNCKIAPDAVSKNGGVTAAPIADLQVAPETPHPPPCPAHPFDHPDGPLPAPPAVVARVIDSFSTSSSHRAEQLTEQQYISAESSALVVSALVALVSEWSLGCGGNAASRGIPKEFRPRPHLNAFRDQTRVDLVRVFKGDRWLLMSRDEVHLILLDAAADAFQVAGSCEELPPPKRAIAAAIARGYFQNPLACQQRGWTSMDAHLINAREALDH